MPQLSAPSPIRISEKPDPNRDYISRSLLSAYLTRSVSTMVGIIAKGGASDALPQRVLTLAGVAKPSKQPVLDVFDQVVDSINNGTDISPTFPVLSRLIHAQESRAEVVKQLTVTHDYQRLARATRARDRLEESLYTQAMNDDLLPAEKVLLLEKLETIVQATQKRIGAESTTVNDIESLLEKIDYATEAAGTGLRKKFEGTSAQGREVVRKLALQVAKRLKQATANG